jgi:hypothetical protein
MALVRISIAHQPQQSDLKPHDGHRQTACMRNISVPHRSQGIASAERWHSGGTALSAAAGSGAPAVRVRTGIGAAFSGDRPAGVRAAPDVVDPSTLQ